MSCSCSCTLHEKVFVIISTVIRISFGLSRNTRVSQCHTADQIHIYANYVWGIKNKKPCWKSLLIRSFKYFFIYIKCSKEILSIPAHNFILFLWFLKVFYFQFFHKHNKDLFKLYVVVIFKHYIIQIPTQACLNAGLKPFTLQCTLEASSL